MKKMIAPNGKGEIYVIPSKVDEMLGKGWKLDKPVKIVKESNKNG